MGNNLNELASYFLPEAEQLIAAANAAGLDVEVVDTGRTAAEQTRKLADGVSWTKFSKHEPQPPENKSEAIDLAPRSLIGTKFWSPESPLWKKLGEIGEKLGLKWGGRWPDNPPHSRQDPGHFEFVRKTNTEAVQDAVRAEN